MASRLQIRVAAVLALAVLGCALPATQAPKADLAASIPPQPAPLVCRIRQDDKVFNDVLAFDVPVHDDKHGSPLECAAMIEEEGSTLKSTRTIPVLDYGFIWLGAAALWMHDHPEVHQCVEKVEAPNFVLARFLGRAVGTKGPTIVLLRNCDGRVFFVTNAEVPTGIAACEEAHIPDCPKIAAR